MVNGNRYFVLRGIKKLLIIAVLFGVLARGFLKRLPKAFKDETVMAFNKESKVSAHLQSLGEYSHAAEDARWQICHFYVGGIEPFTDIK